MLKPKVTDLVSINNGEFVGLIVSELDDNNCYQIMSDQTGIVIKIPDYMIDGIYYELPDRG